MFDHEASISGTILGDDAGAVTLVAYCGDIESSDFTTLTLMMWWDLPPLLKGNTSWLHIGYPAHGVKTHPLKMCRFLPFLMPMAAKPWMPGTRSFYGDADDFFHALDHQSGYGSGKY
ncbi:MAG: hypothetical protein R2875_13560 [Desulfobacterales bacterium]